MPPRDEIATIRYAKPLPLFKKEKPFTILSNLNAGENDPRRTNVELEDGEEQVIHDIRGREAEFSLDTHGFQVAHHTTSVRKWNSARDIEEQYFGEVADLLRREMSSITEIHIFDWRLRRSAPNAGDRVSKIDLNNNAHYLLPVTTAHIDQTPRSVLSRVRRHLGERAEELLRGRVRLVNVWRPIGHSVGDWPLALCDGTTVEPGDLLATDHITKSYVGETYNMLYREKYKWYYLSDQAPDEVLLFKMFDSSRQVEARWCPHAAFKHRAASPDAPPRESIEVRALVFGNE
ncbi:methyltransferase CmcJ [Echria macrotheca]|uniref:Methyltransferase CmcJ n=1 Tax=Echria macrotheca TaxID=438768 RepID=A0AAJ0F799_9PEZI|nr:methyltransferase CmcJ [Echria macrotheca]